MALGYVSNPDILNPVRAQMVLEPLSGHSRDKQRPSLFDDRRSVGRIRQTKKRTQMAYRAFVKEGRGPPSPLKRLKHQVYLGSDEFIEDMLSKLAPDQSLQDIPKSQKQSLRLNDRIHLPMARG